MRGPALIAIALVALSLVPAPAALAAEEALVADAEGDTVVAVAVSGNAQSTPLAADATRPADIVALSVEETERDVAFTITVAGLADAQDPGGDYAVRFRWGDAEYAAVVEWFSGDLVEFEFAHLTVETPSGPDRIAELAHAVDVQAGRVSVTVPKHFLLDSAGRAPVRGASLDDVHATADRWIRASLIASVEYHITDRAPDTGGVPVTFAQGDVATGHLSLASPERVRVSNGGSGTIVYRVTVANAGGADDEIRIHAEGAPEGWAVDVPTTLRVPAGGERVVPVMVTLPFAHTHGGFESLVLRATSVADASAEASLTLGVLHTPVPQPAGHHPDLFLHAERGNPDAIDDVFTWASPSMSTESDHANDASIVPAQACPGGGSREWRIPLAPSLALGLDFDLSRTGTLVGSFTSVEPLTGGVRAALFLARGAGADAGTPTSDGEGFDAAAATLLAAAPEAPYAVDANAVAPFELALTPTPESDYVPYANDQNLWLVLTLRVDDASLFCSGVRAAPHLVTEDFKLSLPLDEYRDRLDVQPLEAAVAGGVAIVHIGESERVGAPGSTLAYAFTISNSGDAERAFALDVGGTHAGLGRVAGATTIRLGAAESRTVTMAVDVPEDAADGAVLEVVLVARALDDPAVAALAHTRTTVSSGADAAPDESDVVAAAAESEREAPAAGAALLVAGAAALALATRRRT